jgi:sugar-specific transcriptional regulator TrmB
LKKGAVENTLKDFGLTESEVKVYVFLGKRGVLKGGYIAEHLKMYKSEVYRTLRKLQKKGLVEATLEYPTRFTAVPLEKVIDSFIKSKREEVALIEKRKDDILSDWNRISRTESDSSPEKFAVIEGNKKIFNKISQMVNNTNSQFLISLTISDMLEAERFGIFDSVYNHPIKSNIQFRVLTQLSKENLKAVTILKSKLDPALDFRGRNPSLGLPTFSRMAIKDKEESIIFTSYQDETISKNSTCLWTNSKSIINAFYGVFENLWQNSINLKQKLDELTISGISNQIDEYSIITKKKLYEALNSAEKEIIIVTTSEGLKELPENNFQKLSNLGISIKIMVPITNENLNLSQQFLKFCEVKHISSGYLPSIIVDKKFLFQLNTQSSKPDAFFLVKDHNYMKKTRKILENAWRTSYSPTTSTLTQFSGPTPPLTVPNINEKSYSVYRNSIGKVEEKSHEIRNEEDIIREFINAKEYPVRDVTKDVVRAYQSSGHAIIHPPTYFNLPKMFFHFYHVEKKSSFGREDFVNVTLWMNSPQGPTFVPVVSMGDNPRSHEAFKIWFKGTPAEDNIRLVNHDEIEIRVHGNTMFAAWSIPIPLIGEYVVPPACMIIEGYGNLKTGSYVATLPSGYDFKVDTNGFDAFVSFIHPKSKYSGPGTEGYLGRDEIMDISLATPTKQ